jgi:hypothetical protein
MLRTLGPVVTEARLSGVSAAIAVVSSSSWTPCVVPCTRMRCQTEEAGLRTPPRGVRGRVKAFVWGKEACTYHPLPVRVRLLPWSQTLAAPEWPRAVGSVVR